MIFMALLPQLYKFSTFEFHPTCYEYAHLHALSNFGEGGIHKPLNDQWRESQMEQIFDFHLQLAEI